MYKKLLISVLVFATACMFNGSEKKSFQDELKFDIQRTPTVAELDIEAESTPVLPIAEVIDISEETIQADSVEEVINISEETISAEEPDAAVSEEDIELLACTIYCEAGGDAVSDLCRYYVADTVLNRVDSPNFPNTIYEVLTAPMAYGRFHWTGVVWPDYSYSVWEQPAIERAYRIARDVLVDGNHTWIYGNHYVYQSEYCQSEVGFYLDGFYFGAE